MPSLVSSLESKCHITFGMDEHLTEAGGATVKKGMVSQQTLQPPQAKSPSCTETDQSCHN